MTSTNFTAFRDLHFAPTPFLLPNAWDAASAALYQREGALAVGTSSAALAWSLGYPDGGALPRHELMSAIRRIARVLHVPLSIDIEDGYSDSPEAVAELALEIALAGVAGINIEDGANSPDQLCQKISAIRHTLAGVKLFINARTDGFLRQLAPANTVASFTIDRLKQYREAGADAAFVPGLVALDEIRIIAPAIGMPLNLMMLPGMPAIADLAAAGAQRFSVGPALFQASYGHACQLTKQFVGAHQVAGLFEHAIAYDEMNALLHAAG